MLCAVNKQAVATSFSRHASHYQQHAQVQQQTAAVLLRLLRRQLTAQQQAGYLVDVGCGPGVNAAALQPLAEHYVGIDIAPGMLQRAKETLAGTISSNYHLLQADMEQLPLANASVDIVYANLAVQWCSEPRRLLTELARVVSLNNGIVALSTVLPNSLQPLAQLREGYHGCPQVRGQHAWPQWLAAAEQAGWQALEARTQEVTAYFPSLRALLRSISKVGASVEEGIGSPLSRQELHYLQQAYSHHQQPQGLPLRYQIGYLILQQQYQNR